jgi:hypothetical protein
MILLLARFRGLMAVSLAIQGVLGVLWWWYPQAMRGSYALALALFPGVVFAWAAIHTSLLIGTLVVVFVNVCYHLMIGVVIATAVTHLRSAV